MNMLPTPRPLASRPSRSRSHRLGWILGIVTGVFVLLLAIGFGATEEAHHHFATATSSVTAGPAAALLAARH